MANAVDRIETAANGYRFRLQPYEIDIDRFEQLAGGRRVRDRRSHLTRAEWE